MLHDYCDFEFVVDEGCAEEVSAFVLAGNPYLGRAFRSAIESAYGVIPPTMPLKKAFAAARDAIVTAACQKVIALDGEIDRPVPIIGSDICRRAAERSKPVRQP